MPLLRDLTSDAVIDIHLTKPNEREGRARAAHDKA